MMYDPTNVNCGFKFLFKAEEELELENYFSKNEDELGAELYIRTSCNFSLVYTSSFHKSLFVIAPERIWWHNSLN